MPTANQMQRKFDIQSRSVGTIIEKPQLSNVVNIRGDHRRDNRRDQSFRVFTLCIVQSALYAVHSLRTWWRIKSGT